MGKRGHGEGSFRERAPGSWEARISLPDGKRRSFYGKTRAEVAAKVKQAHRDLESGIDLGATRQTVGAFLEAWLADTVRPNRAPNTYRQYRDLLRTHVIPALGHHELGALTAPHVAALVRAKTRAGLSPKTVLLIRGVLRTALNQALKWALVARNVAALVEAPRQVHREVTPFTVAEARALIAATETDRLGPLYRLALTLGLRQGEVLGLSWEDVDLDTGTLRVRRSLGLVDGALVLRDPKTARSRRTLRLPAPLVAALRAHRDRQLFERTAAGSAWPPGGLVFVTTTGTPIDPRNLLRSWHRVLADAGLDRRTFHTTRHTAASLLIAEGVPLKVVQEVLGHTLLSTTSDIYGHLYPEAFAEASAAMERALG